MGLWIQRTPLIIVFIFRLRFSTMRFGQCLPACMHGHGPPSTVRYHLLSSVSWGCILIVFLSSISFFYACLPLSYCVLCSLCGPTSCRCIDRVFYPFRFVLWVEYPCLHIDQILPTYRYQTPLISSSSIPLGDLTQTRTLKLELWPVRDIDLDIRFRARRLETIQQDDNGVVRPTTSVNCNMKFRDPCWSLPYKGLSRVKRRRPARGPDDCMPISSLFTQVQNK